MSSAPRSERHERLLKSTSVVGSMTLLSRISGLAREVAFSHWFGAGIVMDAFVVAFRIPNMFRRFFAEGAFSQAFVPVMSEYRAKTSAQATKDLVDRVCGTLTLVLFAITAVGVVAAPVLIAAFAPGFIQDDGRYEIATGMLRLTFPYLFFISLTALAGGILNTYGRFAVPAFTPVLLNLVLILFAGLIAPGTERPGLWLAAGVFVAGIVQLGFQAPFLARLHLLPRPRWGWAHDGVKRILKLMVPVIFGSSVAQISILFDMWIASFLAAGSVSWLYYSDRLVEFPLGVFGIALATVILPRLSRQHVDAAGGRFSGTLDWALKLVLVIGVPAALGLMLLAEPLMATIFFGGAFTDRDVAMAAASLQAFAPGLLGFILVKVLSPGYFARQDTRTPVRVAVRALLLGMLLNVVFVLVLVATDWFPPHAGLAAATSCSALFNSTMLLAGLLRAGVYAPGPGWRALSARVAAASAVMALVVIVAARQAGDWLAAGAGQRAAMLAACVLGGGAVYFAACYAFGVRAGELRARGIGGPE